MAMEGLGRVFNVIPLASGVAINMRDCDAITFITTTAATDTFSLTIATSFGGTYRAGSFFTPAWTPVNHFYRALARDGSAAWAKVAQTAADNWVAGAGASVTCAASVMDASIPDTYRYIKCTAGGAGLVTAILHDLDVARTPANLAIVSA